MIRVKGLTKKYGDRIAVENLNFSVQKGEVVGFLGPNGAGKTTTMKMITGFLAASSGRVTVDGDDVFEKPLKTKSKIGYLPESPPVYTDMKVYDYLVYVAKLKKVPKLLIKTYVDECIQQTQLQVEQHRLIGNLSKGFRQRVGIAGALVSKPAILILDEPTVGLDPKQVLEIRNLILSLRGQHTIFISSHILPEIQATCDRVIIINSGVIVAEESLTAITQAIRKTLRFEIQIQRNADKLLTHLEQLEGVSVEQNLNNKLTLSLNTNFISVEELSSIIVNEGFGLLQFKQLENHLESAYIELTENKKEVSL